MGLGRAKTARLRGMKCAPGVTTFRAAAAGRLQRGCLSALLVAALIVVLPSVSAAQDQHALRGVALVIGQSKYEHLSPLPNPANDADAIEALLADLGFDSVRRADRDAKTLARDLERFAEDAEEADVAVLYYSGHGIEAGGENFLVPVDADLSALDDAGLKLVPVSALIEKLKATVPVAIVMLDACRNNPFPLSGSTLRLDPGAEPVAVGGVGLGASRGAASLNVAETEKPAGENVGTVIAFAAEPGKVALDGEPGQNSPYAAALLRHLPLTRAVGEYQLNISAQTLNNWANATNSLYAATKRHEALAQSIDAYERALKVLSRDRVEEDWVVVQHNLAGSLMLLGEAEDRQRHARTLHRGVSSRAYGLDPRSVVICAPHRAPIWMPASCGAGRLIWKNRRKPAGSRSAIIALTFSVWPRSGASKGVALSGTSEPSAFNIP